MEGSPKIGAPEMSAFPQTEEDRHEEKAIRRKTDCPDFVRCGSEDVEAVSGQYGVSEPSRFQ